MELTDRIEALVSLGFHFKSLCDSALSEEGGDFDNFSALCLKAYYQNKWFTEKNTLYAASVWAEALTKENIERWLNPYDKLLSKPAEPKRISVINPGNIPFVGLHDFISVLITGNQYIGKNSSDDSILLPYIAELLIEIEPRFKQRIQFVERVSETDAVIATGSNNTFRYFEYYFSKYPHLLRKNRNGVAVLTGNESSEELKLLGKDIFQYFGLGCRNVSKLYVPKDYDFKNFFGAMVSYSEVMQHNKYMNNFDHHNAVLLLKQIPFLQNGFLIVLENPAIASPIAVVHYEKYDSIKDIEGKLIKDKEKIQCVVSAVPLANIRTINFGETQSPQLWDYADGVDTVKFLLNL